MHAGSWKEAREKIKELQAENDRLRVIEGKAREVAETMACNNEDLEDFRCGKFLDCVDCELKQLEDALKTDLELKGGS